MATIKGGLMAAKQKELSAKNPMSHSIASLFNDMLSSEGYQKRFDELLGKRAPQFISSVVSLLNADSSLQQVFRDAPVTIIQSALRAASYDLPIDPGLGYAYIVPFNNKKKDGSYRMEATFILGYKGMNQLAIRTGVYKKINVVDVREGELINYDRLTEDIMIEFVDDEDEREKLPVIGYCGYFRLSNGMEKTIYMSKKQIDKHEQKFRKGKYMSKGWKDNYDAMALKTVYRKLIGKWGIMSIDYQKADAATIAAATAISSGQFDDEDKLLEEGQNTIDTSVTAVKSVPDNIDPDTGEVLNGVDHTEDDKILDASLDM
jgi:recombination protein RecT